MDRKDIYGHMASTANQRYDLMEMVMVCLGRPESATQGTKLHQLLTTVLSKELMPQEKIEVMEKEYGIVATTEMKGEIVDMCNLADYFEEIGIEQGMQKGIQQGIQQGALEKLEEQIRKKLQKNKTLEQSADELETELEELRPIYERLKSEMTEHI